MRAKEKYAFGEYTFDCASGELTRDGRRLHLPDQVARLLAQLLEAKGELVTREQIRQSLWSADEHLDHDLSINKAAYQLRLILRENRQQSRFLETLPKRGYRFHGIRPIPEPNEALEAVRSDSVPGNDIRLVLREEAVLEVPPQPLPGRSKALWIGTVCTALVLLSLSAAFWGWRKRPQSVAPVQVSIVIAPIESIGENDEASLESLRMDLADAISQLPEVQVRAIHSLNATHTDASEIPVLAAKLHTDFFLFSHLILSKRDFVLQMELIRGRDASHVASLRYAGTRQELFTLRERVQRDLFARLALTQNAPQHAMGSTDNPAAYDAYLQGRALLEERADDSLRRSYAAFERAVAVDPHFSAAYAGMAHAEMLLAEHEAIPPAAGYQTTRELTLKALAEKPDLAEAHALLGFSAFRLDWNFATAENELRAAINLDPNVPIYHVFYAILLYDQSRFAESFQQIDDAHALDPLWGPIYLTESTLAAGARDSSRMMAAAHKLAEMMPNWSLAHDQLAWSYWYAGNSEQAIQEWRRMAELENDASLTTFEEQGLRILHQGGRIAYARYRLAACLHNRALAHNHDFVPAEWSAYAGDKEEALRYLRQEVDRHSVYALRIGTLPPFFEYHDDPRFRYLLSRVGLPVPPAAKTSSPT